MIKLFAILLISIGSFLEIWYYAYRFSNDGIETWLSITIGIALTLFLCMAILNRNKKGMLILILTLIIYSILATSAGQSFSLSLFQKDEIHQDVQEEYRQDEIEEIQYRIQQIDEKYSQIQSGINETTQTLHDRGVYRTALEKAENQQLLLNDERKQLQVMLTELRNKAVTYEGIEERKTNIYEFYNKLTFIPETWLQFIFQTWLSIFIAIMAPLGITTLQSSKRVTILPVAKPIKQEPINKEIIKEPIKEKPKKEKIKKEPAWTWIMLIERWVYINWFGIRSKKSRNMLSAINFFAYARAHGKEFPKKYYKKINAIAIKMACVNSSGAILNNNEAEVIGRIVNYMSRKR